MMADPAALFLDLPGDGEADMSVAQAVAPIYVGPFAGELAKLQAENPTPDPRRWEQAKRDATAFLGHWGEQVAEFGWTAEDLFGLHPVAPLTRYDVMGLIWLLNGKEVEELSAQTAKIGASTFYR